MKTSVYICADGTLTYGPYGGKQKIIPQALPIAIVEDENEANSLIVTVGRRSYDAPEADPRFEQALRGRAIQPGYGPDHRYYYSLPEFERDNVETVFSVRERVEQILDRMRSRR